ncbi:hypothetical protein JCM16303_004650 [Sporobolomyces ruberrimus]
MSDPTPLNRHATSHAIPTLSDKVRLSDLVSAFALQGQEHDIFDVEHPRFDYIPDGMAAAVRVAHEYADRDELVRLLAHRLCDPADITEESYSVLKGAVAGITIREYARESEKVQLKHWTRVCRKYKEPGIPTGIARKLIYDSSSPTVPSAPVSPTASSNTPRLLPTPPASPHSTRSQTTEPLILSPVVSTQALVSIRFREPLPYPTPLANVRLLFGFVQGAHSDGFLPTSPIFFASRFHRLRELSRLLRYALHPRHSSSSASEEWAETQEERNIKKEIYGVLLGMLMFYLGTRASRGAQELGGFDYGFWKRVYERCGERGSEVFGLKDGFGLNREFFEEITGGGKLDDWFWEASEWWIEGDGWKEWRDRDMIVGALRGMERKLGSVLNRGLIARDFPHLVLPVEEFIPQNRQPLRSLVEERHRQTKRSNSRSSQD